MSKQETLEKIVIDLLFENRELKDKLKSEKESSDLWWREKNKLETKVEELEAHLNEQTLINYKVTK